MAMDIRIKCITLNVRGIRDKNKRKKLFHWIESTNSDITFLQETYCTSDIVKDIEKDWPGTIINNVSDSVHSRGCMILFSPKFEYKMLDFHLSDDGRNVLVNIMINECIFTLVCCYAPNIPKARCIYFNSLWGWIKELCLNDKAIICAGDLNCVDSIDDRQSGNMDKSAESFTSFKKNLGLKDVWKTLHPSETAFTYIDPKGKCCSRIDYMLVSDQLCSFVDKCDISISPAPDHKAVIMSLNQNVKKRGPGYWKLNNSVINEQAYADVIEEIINRTTEEYENETSYVHLWELLKLRIKEASIKYCIRRRREDKTMKRSIENLIDHIDSLLHNNENNDECDRLLNQRNKWVKELDCYYMKEAKGAQIRSRAKWVEECEKSTAYFFQLERVRQESSVITRLKTSEGDIVTKDDKILEAAAVFYRDLFNSKISETVATDGYLNNIRALRTLNEEENSKCEGEISEKEMENAVNKMKMNKSPGPDGLTVEFYQKFWGKVGPILVKVYNECYRAGSLGSTQSEAIITLIHKGGDRDLIKNYRPISLTNVDYKIIAAVLSYRLEQVIDKIVSPDQTGYIKGRFIGTNIRLIEDLIEHAGIQDRKGVLLFLDFKKAYDSLEWYFMFKTLEKLNFGQSFINWVKILYTSPTCRIKNNGYFSQSIAMTRGIRQGCPLSARLFVLSVEMLAEHIRQSNSIVGISMNPYGYNKEARISQYADDSIVILKDHQQVDSAIKVVEEFSCVSGLELNLSKTQGMLLGKEQNIPQDILSKQVVWSNKPVKCLGIYVGTNKHDCELLNWNTKLDKIQSILHSWKKRDLTLFGKVLIIKTLAIPLLLYPACNTIIAYNIIPKVNKILFSFIWPGSEKVKRNVAIGAKEDGGLGMTHIESLFEASKASWIRRILEENAIDPPTWCIIPFYVLNMLGKDFIVLHFNVYNNILPVFNMMPQFYSQVVKCWNKAKVVKIPENNEWLNEIIWGNRLFTVQDKNMTYALYFKTWIEVGLIYVKDLFISNSIVDDTYVYNKVKKKANFFHEMSVVRKALSIALRGKSVNNKPNVTGHASKEELLKHPLVTKEMYKVMLKRCFEKPDLNKKWNVTGTVAQNAFSHKVKNVIEIKLSEFGFKVLHKILACAANLKKWKIIENDECQMCSVRDDIEHLLIDCVIAKYIWQIVFPILQLNYMKCNEVVIFGQEDKMKNHIISLIAYILYKYWLRQNQRGKAKSLIDFKCFITYELSYRIKIYNAMKNNYCTIENTLREITNCIV